jgi:hypothetical protein
MFLSSTGPLSTDGIGMITLSPLERTRDLLPDIQTEEDLQAIFEANYVSTDNTDIAISETEHNNLLQILLVSLLLFEYLEEDL